MSKKKLTEIELAIKLNPIKEIDYSYQQSVSFSQFSTYLKCPYQWYLSYVEKFNPFASNIHTIFGDAIHETLQEYLNIMYNESGAASDRMDIISLFEEKFISLYKDYYKKSKVHVSNPVELREFFEDGKAILIWIQKNRNKIFTIRKVKLIGIELEILQKVKNNLYFKGYIDLILYDEDLDKVYIYDIKTSTRGWKDKDKKDETKTSQVVFYKEFFSKQYNWDIDKIEVEFFIVKRKIWEESEFPIPRVQRFSPSSGKVTRNKIMNKFNEFINNSFNNDGKYITTKHNYSKNIGEDSCKWCPYTDKPEICDKNK